jgi:hypothetical protein
MMTELNTLEDVAELYCTPPYVVKALLKRETFPGSIWEPAAGEGDIVKILLECGYRDVQASDLHDWEFQPCRTEDFLKSTYESDSLVTNPPYSLKAKFLTHAKRLVRHKIAMLLPLDFEYTGCFLSHHRSDPTFSWKALYGFVQGIGWLKRTDRSGRRKVGWFVFERGYRGPVIRETIQFRPNRSVNQPDNLAVITKKTGTTTLL